jgi:hypothetical protein
MKIQPGKIVSNAFVFVTAMMAGSNAFVAVPQEALLDSLPVAVMTQELPSGGSGRTEAPYRGFDTSRYPGDDAMKAWWEAGEYDWVGYYLPSPCHKDASWSGSRERLETMGWGLAVIYVGQQTWGLNPRPSERFGPASRCSARELGAARGRFDADDAIAQAEREGFQRGTMIFLDLEHMPSVGHAMRVYYRAWTERLLENGRYRPGYYAHTSNAALIYEDVTRVFDRMGIAFEPSFWIAGGSDFARDRLPVHVGHHFAAAWQGVLDIVEEQAGIPLSIDVSVGVYPSPSSHAIATD